jgi:pimeloyl-ACP methyl ester carboxylesterase
MHNDFESIDAGGRNLRYICAGGGSPTVVVDQGQGLSIERSFSQPAAVGWAKVFSEVKKSTRVCMHDRAGLGLSDAASAPRTSFDMVKDLRTVLRQGDIGPPYVLVGHSIGGFNARLFASQYPDEVVGMVLVDSSHPDQTIRFTESLPAEAPGEIAILQGFRRWPEPSTSSEHLDLRASAEQARNASTLGVKPLIVLSQSPNSLRALGVPSAISETIQTVWAQLQHSLLSLSRNSVQIVATHAGHNIQLDEPQLVIDAILNVVNQVRTTKASIH